MILALVSVFHAAVFCGLAYWIAGSKQFKIPAKMVAVWFVVGAIIANIILCVMLFELTSGVMIVMGGEMGDTSGLGKFMLIVLAVQPFFGLALFPAVKSLIQRRIESSPVSKLDVGPVL